MTKLNVLKQTPSQERANAKRVMKTHWFAICESQDGTPYITNELYGSHEEAERELGGCLLKLWVSGPSVELFVRIK